MAFSVAMMFAASLELLSWITLRSVMAIAVKFSVVRVAASLSAYSPSPNAATVFRTLDMTDVTHPLPDEQKEIL
jgi:hypothetical protein